MTALIIHASEEGTDIADSMGEVTVIDTDDKLLHIWKELPDDLPTNMLQALIFTKEMYQVDSKGVEHQVTSLEEATEEGIMLCLPLSILSVEATYKLIQSLN